MRNSQYAEAMITNYFTYVHTTGVLTNSQGDGLMAYISRKDCAKAVAYALFRGDEYHKVADRVENVGVRQSPAQATPFERSAATA